MNVKELIGKYEYLNHNYFRRVDTSEVLRDLKQLDEPQKVKIPQFVADWIEESKKHCKNVVEFFKYKYPNTEMIKWIESEKRFDLIARAWLDGYEVEKEKRYRISMPKARNYKNHAQILCEEDGKMFWCGEWYRFKTKFTRKQLEDAGFGEVFNSTLFEVEEVE